MDERTHHVGLIADAFLVRKGGDRDRTRRLDVRVAKRERDRKTGEYAVAAVERAGVLYGVDMRADHQRLPARGRRVGVQRAEDVADAVDPDVEVQLAHPRDDAVAARALVVGQRDARAAAELAVGADLAELAQLTQKDCAVQLQRGVHSVLPSKRTAPGGAGAWKQCYFGWGGIFARCDGVLCKVLAFLRGCLQGWGLDDASAEARRHEDRYPDVLAVQRITQCSFKSPA